MLLGHFRSLKLRNENGPCALSLIPRADVSTQQEIVRNTQQFCVLSKGQNVEGMRHLQAVIVTSLGDGLLSVLSAF